MSKKLNSPKDWADKNVGVRWDFSEQQSELIYELIDKIWDKKKKSRLVDATENLDYDLEMYKLQDTTIENVPKEFDKDTLGGVFEAAGDILRELFSRETPDFGYIQEKIFKIKRYIGWGAYENVSEKDKKRIKQVVDFYKRLKVKTERAKKIVELIEMLGTLDSEKALTKLNEIENVLLSKKSWLVESNDYDGEYEDAAVELFEWTNKKDVKYPTEFIKKNKLKRLYEGYAYKNILDGELLDELVVEIIVKLESFVKTVNEWFKKHDSLSSSAERDYFKLWEKYGGELDNTDILYSFSVSANGITIFEALKQKLSSKERFIALDNFINMAHDRIDYGDEWVEGGRAFLDELAGIEKKSSLIKQAYIVTEETIQKLICDSLQCYMAGNHPEIQIERPVKIEKELANDLLEGWAIGKEGQQKFKIDFIVHLNTYISDLPKVEVNRIAKLTEAQSDTAVVIMGWEKYKKSHPIEEDRIRRIIDEFIVIKEDYDYWDKKVRKILKDYGIYFGEKKSWLVKNKTAPTYPEHKVDPKFSPFIQERYDDAVRNIRRLLKKEIKPIADETEGRYRVVISDNNKMFYFRDDRPDDPVPTGKWMDWVEKHWKISEEEYRKLPREERATMEAKEQLDKWVEKEYEAAWLEIYSPKEYDKLWWEERKKLPEEAQYNLGHPAWQKLVKDVFKKEVEKVEKKMEESQLIVDDNSSGTEIEPCEINSQWLLSSAWDPLTFIKEHGDEIEKMRLSDFKDVPWEKFYKYVSILKKMSETTWIGEQAMERLDTERGLLHEEITKEIIEKNKLKETMKMSDEELEYTIRSIIEKESARELKKMSWLIDVAATIKKKSGKEFFKRVEKGYIGKYGINDHHATTHHWDLRLEMLEGELKTYYKKRDMKNPPTDIKSSYVSFAIGKHTFPTGDKKLMIIQTEDHPLKYMEGNIGQKFTIPEGEYGGGYYFLYDKGKYQVLDVDAKRIVIYISGKKEKGAYALVYSPRKEKSEFLFMKLKNQDKNKLEEEYEVKIKV